jgi:hypothetical protein
VGHIIIPALVRLTSNARKEDCEFKTSLGYIIRLCLKNKHRREREREREREKLYKQI